MSYRTTSNSSTSPAAIARAERRAAALDLRKQGHDFVHIGLHLGVSPTTVYRGVKQALREIGREPARELLHLELERLDHLQCAVHAAACEGDIKAIDACLAIMDRRAKLVGLYDMARDPTASPQISVSVSAGS